MHSRWLELYAHMDSFLDRFVRKHAAASTNSSK